MSMIPDGHNLGRTVVQEKDFTEELDRLISLDPYIEDKFLGLEWVLMGSNPSIDHRIHTPIRYMDEDCNLIKDESQTLTLLYKYDENHIYLIDLYSTATSR